ncbi:hypothetical protein B0H14DRAFT_3445735 [Mycena olivaceomarginata]|nr:hypothetical protein B0H14DRAFT_3445735 [Mycena olivaceomarginata]
MDQFTEFSNIFALGASSLCTLFASAHAHTHYAASALPRHPRIHLNLYAAAACIRSSRQLTATHPSLPSYHPRPQTLPHRYLRPLPPPESTDSRHTTPLAAA